MKNVFKYASIIGCTFASLNFAADYVDYKVKNGDTLFGIAFAHDMSANEFLKVNNIKDPDKYNLKVGEVLKVKDKGYTLVYDTDNKVFGLKGEEGNSYKDYKVQNGDTLFGIAFAHGMTANEFLAINNIKDANKYNLRVGQTLKVANNQKESNSSSNNINNSNNTESYDTYKVIENLKGNADIVKTIKPIYNFKASKKLNEKLKLENEEDKKEEGAECEIDID